MTTKRQENGEISEKEVCEFVPCPNCNAKLMQLIKNNPLYDVQCSRCVFRAQVKSTSVGPSNIVNGAGWKPMEYLMKTGGRIPELFVNFKWKGGQEIRYYPYVNKTAFTKRVANITKGNRKHLMFKYDLTNFKYYVVYKTEGPFNGTT